MLIWRQIEVINWHKKHVKNESKIDVKTLTSIWHLDIDVTQTLKKTGKPLEKIKNKKKGYFEQSN